jgi:hypothetical protein
MIQWAAPRRAQTVHLYARYIRAFAALGRGDVEDAYQHASVISPPGILASHVPLALWAAMDLVEAAVRTCRPGHRLLAGRAVGVGRRIRWRSARR